MTPEPGWLPLAFRLARRELRSGLHGFRIFLACLAIGVAAIAAVGSVSAAIEAGLRGDARVLLGGDAEFRLAQRDLPEDALAWLKTRGTVAVLREERGMLRRLDGDAPSLVELKAVDDLYPLYGAVRLAPSTGLADAIALRDGVPGLVVDPSLLDRLGLAIGDRVRLGGIEAELRATLVKEPDGGGNAFALGPRVLLSLDALRAAGLTQSGTLSASLYRLRLPPGGDARKLVADANSAFPGIGWQARDFSEAAPSIRSFVDRTATFLTLVGLTALLVGGVGVGSAAGSYLGAKSSVIATLKCLGASSRLIYAIYLIQIMSLAGLGIVIGLCFGALAPWMVMALAGDLLPVALHLGLYPGPLALAAGFGLLTALGFTLWPLGRARLVPAAALFRGVIAARLGLRDWFACGLVGAALAGLAVASAAQPVLAAWFVLAAVLVLLAFWGAGWLVILLASRLPPLRRSWLRLAIANLHRPGAPTASVVMSLGLGLTVLVALALVEHSLTHEVAERLPGAAPSYFFIDIQRDQQDGFRDLVAGLPGIGDLRMVPSLRGRIEALDGQPIAGARVKSDSRWVVTSERGLTYAATVPSGSRVIAGDWWPADYQGPPLVSLDADIAAGLNLKLGSTITFNIAGRAVTGQVANLRKVDWATLGINFFTVFSPGALEAAPQTIIATARADSPAHEQALARAVVEHFPNVSAIRVRDALDTIARLLGDMAMAIRATALITLAAGILVLSGAIAAGHRRRVYDSVVLKVLGATRLMLARGFLVEYGLLGLVTAVIAAGLGTLAAWLVVTQVMHADWSFGLWRVLATLLAGIIVTLAVGFAGTWRALSAPASGVLRGE